MRTGLVLAAWLLLPLTARAAASAVSHQSREGIYSLIFEPTKISTETVRKTIKLNPKTGRATFETNIETCTDGDPAYARCGSRNLDDPNFAQNAYSNSQKARANLKDLFGGLYPKELKPVVDYFKEIASFDVLTSTAEYNFLQTWRLLPLNAAQIDLDMKDACPKERKKIDAAKSNPAKYKLMHVGWKNCLRKALDAKLPAYPLDAWKKFLTAYTITETFREESID